MNMKIPGILTDVTTKGVVVETSQIKDIPQNKTLEQINADLLGDVADIKGKIPAAATTSNQLADKLFVNDSVATSTATFRGTYRLHDELGVPVIQREPGAPIEYNKAYTAEALAQMISVKDNNDYCFVLVPVNNDYGADTAYTDRYKYNGVAWDYEYTLNSSGFTTEQWSAINSGITQTLVTQIIDAPFESGIGSNSAQLKDGNVAIGDNSVAEGRGYTHTPEDVMVCRSASSNFFEYISYTTDPTVGELYIDVDNTLIVKVESVQTDIGFNFSILSGNLNMGVEYTLLPLKAGAIGDYSHVEGNQTEARGVSSHAEGNATMASNLASHAEGNQTEASGQFSHSEGSDTIASEHASHAEGLETEASGVQSHAEGYGTKASAYHAHAEGDSTEATGNNSHSEGRETIASGNKSHAGGYHAFSRGENSFAHGEEVNAFGKNSIAFGLGTRADAEASTAFGKYNTRDSEILFSVGVGTSDGTRDNAIEVKTNGKVKISKDLLLTGLNWPSGSSVQSLLNGMITTDTQHGDKINALETSLANTNSWIDDVATDVSSHETQLTAIEGKIPSAATSSNQLADKNFVNSSIATATATFRGSYRLFDDLGVTVTGDTYDKATCISHLASTISSADNNDYCFVVVPTENTAGAATQYIDRYKYNGTAWSYEYTLNNSGFTAEQWAAINSGINANVIPSAASADNQLADKNYVNGQIKAPVTKRKINVTLNQLGIYDSDIDISNEVTLAYENYCPVLEVHVSGIINEVFLVPIYYLNQISACGGEAVVNKYRLRVIQISVSKSRFILERLVNDLPYTEKINADGIIETDYWDLTNTTKPYNNNISNSTLYNHIKKWGLTSLKVNSVINGNNYGAVTKPIQTLSDVDGYFVGDFVGETIPTTRAVSGFYMIVSPTNIQVQLDDRLTGLTGHVVSTALHPTADELIHKLDPKYFDAVKTADLAGYGTDVAPNGELHFGDEFDFGTSNGQANSVILKTPFTSSEKTKLSDLPTNATLETRLQTIEGSSVFEAGTGNNSAKTKNSGAYVIASGVGSFVNGSGSSNTSAVASGDYSHAEGCGITAFGDYSHAEGFRSKAIGLCSHAEGYYTIANKEYSHAEGGNTKTTNFYEHASGKYNNSLNNVTLFSIGCGTNESARKNAFEVDTSGNVYIKGINDYDGTNPSADVSIQNFCNNIILDGYTIDDTISTPYHGTVTIKKDNQPVSGADLYNTLKGYWDKGKVPVLKILLSSATASYNLPMYYQPIGEMASHLVFSNDVVIGLRISSTGVANLVLNSVTNLFT